MYEEKRREHTEDISVKGKGVMDLKDAGKNDLIRQIERLRQRIVELENLTLEKEGLVQKNSFLANIVESSRDAIIGMTVSGAIVSWNKGAERIFGYTAQEAFGCNISMLVPADRQDEIIEIQEKVASGQHIDHLETVRLRKDGTPIQVAFTTSPILNATRAIVGRCVILKDITDRKNAEKALRENEDLLRLTLEAVNDGVWDWNVPTGKAAFSPHYYVMLGYEPYEFPENYESLRNLVHPDDIDRVEAEIKEHLASGKSYAIETRMRTKAGEWRWILTRGMVVERDTGGHPVRLVGTHTDITGKKEAEERLVESEGRYRTIIEYSNDAIVIGKSGLHFYVNRKFLEMFGFERPEEILGQPASVIAHPDDREMLMEMNLKRQRGEDVPSRYEFRGIRKDGTTIFIEVSGAKLWYRGERFSLAFLRDITERKEAEKRLIELAAIVRSSNDAIIGKSIEGTIRSWNRGAEKIYGYTAEEMIGKPISMLAAPGCEEEIQMILEKIKGGEYIESYATVRQRKDKRRIDMSLTISPIRDRAGTIVGASTIGRDITKEKLADSQRKFTNKVLETLNSPHEVMMLAQRVLILVKDYTGIEAIGIRMQEGEDFPYYETNGLPEHFMETERYLCSRGENNEIIRDSEGKPYMECMCGNVICGRTDPSLPFFTPGGSFWTNSTTLLMAGTWEEDRQGRTRNRCHGEGYESVALIPLKSADDIVGLLQLNDRRTDCFTLGAITFLEGVAASIGIAISRRRTAEELEQTTEKLRKSLAGTIRAMSLIVEARDPYTAGHQRRVSSLARAIAQEMGLTKETIDSIRIAGSIHDIGKMSVPAEILSKPSALTDLEMRLIMAHSQSGYEILKDSELPYPVAEMVLQHHERLDGSGYPQGLRNGEILLGAQILAVADTTEAIASHRPYRPAWGIDAALEELERNKGILYGAEAVEACVRLFREKGLKFE